MKDIRHQLSHLFHYASAILLLSIFVYAFTGCKKDEFSGEFEVEMTDSKGDYARVDVEISKVEAYHEGSGWVDLESNSRVYTVSDLTNGKSVVIASRNDLEVGRYSKLRLTIGGNSSISAALGGNLANFSAIAKSTVEIDIDYDLESKNKQSALIDFHLGSSIEQSLTGAFTLDPVITWAKDKDTGVQGTFDSNVRGWVQFSSGSNSFDAYTDASGNFFIRGMASGNYTATCYPATGNGFAEAYTVSNVQVQNGQITSMGTLTFE